MKSVWRYIFTEFMEDQQIWFLEIQRCRIPEPETEDKILEAAVDMLTKRCHNTCLLGNKLKAL